MISVADGSFDWPHAALQAEPGALAKVTVAVLQAYLRSAGLRTSGLKAELIDRVQVRTCAWGCG